MGIISLSFGLLAGAVHAEVTFDWATVGDAGNAGEAQSQGTFGSVGYTYRISKHEVTNAQYVEFLNAKDSTGVNLLALYNSQMSTSLNTGGIDFTSGNANGSKYSVKSGLGAQPVTFVSWYDSIRFANWLHNGQGVGDTESGAYTLTGGTPAPSNGNTIAREANATVFLPSENEWYKAAYYKGGGANAGYWDYATQSDTSPVSDQPPGAFAPNNSANYYNWDGVIDGYNDGYAVTGVNANDPGQNYLTDVGSYTGSLIAYGTLDQNGNVQEWNEFFGVDDFGNPGRGMRGGQWAASLALLPASARAVDFSSTQNSTLGFRVASIIPEPIGMAAWLIGAAMLRRRRRCD